MEVELPVFILGDLNCNTLCKPNWLDEIATDIGLRILNKEPHTTQRTLLHALTWLWHQHLPESIPKGRSYKKKILSYKRTDWEAVNSAIENEAWPPVNDYTSLDENVSIWSNKFQSIIERYTPTKIVKIEPWSKAWYSKDIKWARKRRDRESRRLRKSKLPKNHPTWDKLKRLREEVKSLAEKAKEKRLNKLVEGINGGANDNRTWLKFTWELYNRRNDTSASPTSNK